MLKIYGIKNCDSVKKALKFLKENDIEYELIDFKKEPVGCEKISYWLEHTDMKVLLNSRGTTYRTLKLKELDLNDSQKQSYMCEHNMLIKRPVIEYKDKVLVGFDISKYKGELL
jgi:Spx/MgsR family transcriptional regulator